MKFIPLTLAYLSSFSAKADVPKRTRSLFKDDQSYWNRLLTKGYDSSLTPPPSVKDSENPSPSPSDLPSLMTKSCLIEVRISRTWACDTIGKTSHFLNRSQLHVLTRTGWIALQSAEVPLTVTSK